MVTTRKFVDPKSTPFNVFLRSRLYSTNNLKPSLISIHTRTSSTDPKTTRYPSVEPFLSNFRLQPYVHDTLLFIRRGSYAAHFRVYFKRHKYLSKNRHIDTVRGDVLIMKVSSKNAESLVNMRSFDAMMVDAALPTLSVPLRRFQSKERIVPPTRIDVTLRRRVRRRGMN